MSTLHRFLILLGGLALVTSCATADTGGSTTSEAVASTTTTDVIHDSTTSSTYATTSSTLRVSTTSPSLTVEDVVSVIQSVIDDEYAASEPVEGVLGPYQVHCLESGRVDVGDVLACAATPQSEPDFPLDPAGILIYVVDETPIVAWLGGTDIPDTSEGLLRIYEETPHGLYCRDLLDAETTTWFSGVGPTPATAYFKSLVYWALEGQPDRMDADRNGIPCETLYEPEVVEYVLGGGRLH